MIARRLLLAAGLSLAVVWVLAPQGVPLYDGLGFPDEAYRFVAPPPGTPATPPPTSASVTMKVSGPNVSVQRGVSSAEVGPQVQMELRPSDFVVPAGTDSVTLTATPLTVDVEPADRFVDGNVYRVSADAVPPGSVEIGTKGRTEGARRNAIALRSVRDELPDAAVYFRPTAQAPWQRVETEKIGRHIYVAELSLGDYAVASSARPGEVTADVFSAPSPTEASGDNPIPTVAIVAVAGIGLIATLIAVRLGRRRA